MIRNVIVSSVCFAVLAACSSQVNTPNPSASASAKPSPSASIASPSATPSANPSPSASATVPASKYNLPVKYLLRAECDANASKTAYEVKNNVFSYNTSFNTYGQDTTGEMKSINISTQQSEEIRQLVAAADLDTLAKADVKVDPNDPQTKECRTIDGFMISVDGKDKLFERNDRNFIHSEAYKKSIENLRDQLEAYKNKLTAREIEVNKDFDAKIGDAYTVKAENISLNVVSVQEDSRCPSNVACIQAGQASFNFSYMNKDKKEEFVLTSRAGSADLAMKKIDAYTFRLVKVLPANFRSDATPKTSDYTLTLRVEK
ncbi:hypothetical protein EON78_04340 [bacterium]|nr:MAG: hypothetical protein EON78_04340 [bacterium]